MRNAALTLLLLAALPPSCRPVEDAVEPGLPPIVLITIDTLRADHLGCYGYERDTSPAIDAFAREAIVFDRAFAPMATTLPSHVSLMTALGPLQHGVLGNYHQMGAGFRASDSVRTAAQMLAGIGYRTAAFVSATPLKTHSGIHVGFEVFDEPLLEGRRAVATTNLVLRWLDEREPGTPFLWVHYFDPHLPYEPPAPFDTMLKPDASLLAFLEAQGGTSLSPRTQQANAAYDGEVRSVDAQVGRLLRALRAAGLYEDAAIALVGDHGEALGQHGLVGHGATWNEQLRAPLILKLPASARRSGERRDGLAAFADVLPTLVAALDLPIPEDERSQFAGVDLLQGRGRDSVLAMTPGIGLSSGVTCLIREDWKYSLRPDGENALYDLAADPGETRNLIDQRPEIAARMLVQLQERIARDNATARAAPAKGPLSREVIEALEQLGYTR